MIISSSSVSTSSIVLGAHLGLHSINLTQQKFESVLDDSGCMCRMKV